MNSRFDFHIKGPFALLVLTLLILPVVAALIYWTRSTAPRVEVVMAIVAAGIALTALIYSAITVNQILTTNEQRLVADRLKYAAELTTMFNDPEMPQLTLIANALGKDLVRLQPDEVNEYLQQNKDQELKMIYILNFFESMALAIEKGLADEMFLKEHFELIVRVNYQRLKIYIESQRIEYKSNVPSKKFEALAKRWG